MRLWANWTGPPDADLDAFAQSVRRELQAMRVPRADQRLLERVLDSRRRGVHGMLPVQDKAPRRRRAFTIAAIAAAVAVLFAITISTRDRDAVFEAQAWFGGDHADAQTRPEVPIYPGARVTHPERMRPMRLTYQSTVRTGNAVLKDDIALDASRNVVDGSSAWLVVATTRDHDGALELDSAWVSTGTFEPLRRSIVRIPYRRFDRIEVSQTFDAGHVRGEMHAFRSGAVAAHRRFDRALSPAFAPYVADPIAPVFHSGVTMGRDWKGSIALLGWVVRDDDVFRSVIMRVDGEDTVRVPAGEFDCWRVVIHLASGQRVWYWVRKADGLGVRTLDSTPARTRDVVLTAESTDSRTAR